MKKTILLFTFMALLFSANAQNWQKIKHGEQDFKKVQFVSEKMAFALYDKAQENPYLIKTKDGGKTWETIKVDAKGLISDMYFVDKKVGFLVGDGSTLLKTTNGGKTWQQQYTANNEDDADMSITTVHFLNEKQGFVAGKDLALKVFILQTEDGGKTWTKTVVEGDKKIRITNVTNALMLDANKLFIAGKGISGTFVSSQDGGNTWKVFEEEEFANGDVEDIQFVDEKVGFAITSSSEFLSTTDGGKTWTNQSITIDGNTVYGLQGGIYAPDAQTVYLGGSKGQIVYSQDTGKTWTVKTIGDTEITDLHGFSTKPNVALSKEGILYYFSK